MTNDDAPSTQIAAPASPDARRPAAALSPSMRGFALIWFGQLISGIGSGLTGFTLGVVVFERTGSATQFTFIFLCATLPSIVLLPIAGAFIDRWDRRWMMIIGNIGAGLSKLVLAWLVYAHRLEVSYVYAVVIAVSTFNLFLGTAFTVLTTRLVPRQHYGRASGMVQAAQSAAQILPPVLGGILLRSIQLPGVILVDVATYIVAIATLLAVRVARARARPPEPGADTAAASQAAPPARGPLGRNVTYGWAYIKERPGLLGLLLYFASVNFVISSATVLFTPMVLSFGDAKTLGTILSISGVGFLAGSLVMSVWGGPRKRVRGVFGFGLLLGASSIVASLRPSAGLITVGTVGMFFSLPIINGCSQAIWQSKTPYEVQGRVFAVRRMIGASTIPLAYLLAGPLADRVFEPLMATGPVRAVLGPLIGEGRGRGIALMFMIAGVVTMLSQLGGYLYPRLRNVEDELPEAPAAEAPAELALSRT
jgi:MFS transporter, DHA3 family, macrolide efflux protein